MVGEILYVAHRLRVVGLIGAFVAFGVLIDRLLVAFRLV